MMCAVVSMVRTSRPRLKLVVVFSEKGGNHMRRLQHYLPLFPYILFLIGLIGWIIAVIENLIPAPIIVHVYLHHEGTKEPLKPVGD